MPLYKAQTPITAGDLSALGVMIDKGAIAIDGDFPAIGVAEVGWFYRITGSVTDPVTGKSFSAGDEIEWTGATWILVDSPTTGGPGAVEIVPVSIGAASTLLIDSFPVASIRAAHWLIAIEDATNSLYATEMVHAVHNGAIVTYGSYSSQGEPFLFTIGMTIAAGVLSVDVTNNHTDTLLFKARRESI